MLLKLRVKAAVLAAEFGVVPQARGASEAQNE
jgi:hypothetical protein